MPEASRPNLILAQLHNAAPITHDDLRRRAEAGVALLTGATLPLRCGAEGQSLVLTGFYLEAGAKRRTDPVTTETRGGTNG
ncbi:hypothetical protein [Falsiroseomonas sp. CW058]|uniref:hypothetical protein n=1 Tax=Falsiroseomonas sp. CW058 TaxID=3388664 RepID=UPI003D31A305